jgi:hypothetical protein
MLRTYLKSRQMWTKDGACDSTFSVIQVPLAMTLFGLLHSPKAFLVPKDLFGLLGT